ncbi:MAG: L,D-transpeptidase family protein [Alphaproteobacteria bacterium]|nr:L,D-transpeptidase family protein [Alphaproteobacteria bacterium]
MTDLLVRIGRLRVADLDLRCVVGRGGIVAADAKREGDGATPAGRHLLRFAFFRADRVTAVSPLPFQAIEPDMWWDDDPASPAYNTLRRSAPVEHPERLWRDDTVYDWIVPLGWNDAPPVPGLGSAIFLHVARPDWTPTAGCVAVAHDDWPRLLPHLRPGGAMDIRPG